MRVCLVSREFPPFFGGGIGTYAEIWAGVLAKAGHGVVVVTVSSSGLLERETGEYSIVRVPFLEGNDWSRLHPCVGSAAARSAFDSGGPFAALSILIAEALPALHNEFGFDVVEGPDTGALTWGALKARGAGKGIDAPFVTHVHSPTAWIETWNHSAEPGRAYATLKANETDTIRWADAIVTPSRDMADWVRRHVAPTAPIEVTPLPLGPLASVPLSPLTDERPRRLLFAGRAELRKGIDVLIPAFARAVESGSDVHLDIAGEETIDVRTGRPILGGLLREVTPRVRSRITHHGKVTRDALVGLRAGAHAAILPAPHDNFPYSCVESMAAGLPILASRVGGMAEMVRHERDGILFDPADEDACADAIRLMAGAPIDALRRMGVSAGERIRSFCGDERVLDARIAHYRSAIAAHQLRPQAAIVPRRTLLSRLFRSRSPGAGATNRIR